MSQLSADYYEGNSNNEFYGLDNATNVLVQARGGNDFIETLEISGDVLFGGQGNDVLYVDVIRAGSPNEPGETLYGDDNADPFAAGGDDQILGGINSDGIFGGGGNDFVNADRGNDVIDAGAGDDYIWGGIGEDVIYGGLGNDILIGGADANYPVRPDIVTEWDGRDDTQIPQNDGRRGPWGLAAGEDTDQDTDTNNDTIYGGDGNDSLQGQAGDDTLNGDSGNDLLYGGAGANTLYGGDGDDQAIINTGAVNTIDGGGGTDGITFVGFNAALQVFLEGNALTPVEAGGTEIGLISNIEDVFGGNGDDKVFGDENDNTLFGADGNDMLNGGSGFDNVIGGRGNDTLIGGGFADLLDGQNGKDTFVYNQVSDSDGLLFDTIRAFDASADTLNFRHEDITGVDKTINRVDVDDPTKDLSHAVGAGKLAAHHAVLVNITKGSYAGVTFLIVDANGKAGYQNGQDYLIDMQDMTHTGAFGIGNFGGKHAHQHTHAPVEPNSGALAPPSMHAAAELALVTHATLLGWDSAGHWYSALL